METSRSSPWRANSHAVLLGLRSRSRARYQQVVQVLLLTFSTVFYPIDVVKAYLPSFLLNVVSANPLSLAAEAMRQYTFAGNPIQPLFLLTVLLTSIPFAIVGAASYLMALRGIQMKGKL